MKTKDWTECTDDELKQLAEAMAKAMPNVSHYERIGNHVTVVFEPKQEDVK